MDQYNRDIVLGGLTGLAVGDAFGVPVEFLSREEVREINLQEMVGCDCGLPFSSRWGDLIPRGAWSDDTSMTIAAMSSIISHQGKLDYEDIMKQFLAWWDNGKYASLQFPFGLGTNISYALERYRQGTPALRCGGTGFRDNGNGALMRIFPFSVYCILNHFSDEKTLTVIRQAAGITHGHEITAMSCYMYTLFLRECIGTKDPVKAFHQVFYQKSPVYRQLFSDEAVKAYSLLLDHDFTGSFDADCIPESGYVVDSLSVSVYSIVNTDHYEDAVKKAVLFGYDTDTNGAVTGSVAGAMYGMDQIPERWINVLRKKEELIRIGEEFAECIQIS